MKSSSQIALIIISYQDAKSVANAIQSIDEQEKIIIYILDNGSTNSSLKELKKIKSKYEIRILTSDINLGFPSGVNFVVQKIINENYYYDYMFLLNPDALCSKNLISNLKEILITKSVDIVSPKILYLDGSEWFSGGYIDLDKQEYFVTKNLDYHEKNKILQFNGAAALIKIDSFVNAGMFRNDLFIYGDEAFLSMEYKKLGYKIGYSDKLICYHEVSKIANRTPGLKDYYLNRNNLFFYKKFGINKFILFKNPLKNILYHIKRGNFRNVYSILLAIFHFVINKRGKIN